MSRFRYAMAIAIAAALGLGGCASQSMQEATNAVLAAKAEAEHAKPPAPEPAVRVVGTSWLMGEPVTEERTHPAILDHPISLIRNDLTLQAIATRITKNTGATVNIDPSVYVPLTEGASTGGAGAASGRLAPPTVGGSMGSLGFSGTPMTSAATATMSVDYSGPLSGLLDQVDSGIGVYSRVQADGSILFFRTETKSFTISALNWSTDNESKISSASTTGSSGGGSSVGGAAGSATTTGTGEISVDNKSKVDMWKSLQATAQQVAGVGAQVVPDESSGLLIVTATPPQIARVSAWIKDWNRTHSRLIALDVKVYSVNLSSEDNVGFNPAILYKDLAKSFGLSVAGAPIPTISSGLSPFSFGANVITPTGSTPTAGFYGSNAIFQALSTLGRTSLVISRPAITTNGQPTTIQQALQQGYLASSSTTPSATSGIGPTTTLTPGSVTTGFTLMTVPRIIDGGIMLGMSMTLSPPATFTDVKSNGSEIQTPTLAPSTAQDVVVLKPGQSLMLTGVQQASDSTNDNGVGTPGFKLLGGGRDTQRGSQMLVVVVTARLL